MPLPGCQHDETLILVPPISFQAASQASTAHPMEKYLFEKQLRDHTGLSTFIFFAYIAFYQANFKVPFVSLDVLSHMVD